MKKYGCETATQNFFPGLPKNVGKTWKYEIELIIKRIKYLAENKINNETEELFSKYRHGNNIHEQRKQ